MTPLYIGNAAATNEKRVVFMLIAYFKTVFKTWNFDTFFFSFFIIFPRTVYPST